MLHQPCTDYGLSQKDACLAVAVKLGEPKGPEGVWYPNYPRDPFTVVGEWGWECP